jgi:hypothetical protein
MILCAHDPVKMERLSEIGGGYPLFEHFCKLLAGFREARAFVNVKCDGMTGYIRTIALRYQVLERIVTFDHSMPDYLYAEKHYPDVARCARAGPFEGALGVSSKHAPWVWLDPIAIGPRGCVPFLIRRIKRYHHANEGVRMIVVSPDIHHKDPKAFDDVNMPDFAWEIARLPGVYAVMTDRPTFFGHRQ